MSIFNLFRVFDRAAVTSHPNDIKEKKEIQKQTSRRPTRGFLQTAFRFRCLLILIDASEILFLTLRRTMTLQCFELINIEKCFGFR